ncbi:MAG: alpha/beta hydrolase family protein [Chthoniobacterales bacterium]
MNRNLSTHLHFQRIAQNHTPQYRFAGTDIKDWKQWQQGLLPSVMASLGKMPTKVQPNGELLAEWRHDGLIKQKIVFDVENGLSATGLLFRPENAKGKLPAILCCHGHGDFGKDSVMGNRGSGDRELGIAEHNYDYGLQMAKAGFVTMAIDSRGFGERSERTKADWKQSPDWLLGRDICNLHYLRASIFGMTMLGLNIHDCQCALDYLCNQEYVAANQVGVMGLSFGGTMATWLAICDERVKAADVIGYSDRFSDFAIRDLNFCGSQITHGLYDLCDLPDLQGLIAPKALLVEIGSHDFCFKIESAMSCYG